MSVTDRSLVPLEALGGFLADSYRLFARKLPAKARRPLGSTE